MTKKTNEKWSDTDRRSTDKEKTSGTHRGTGCFASRARNQATLQARETQRTQTNVVARQWQGLAKLPHLVSSNKRVVTILSFGKPHQLVGGSECVPVFHAPLTQECFQIREVHFDFGGDFITHPGKKLGDWSAKNDFVPDGVAVDLMGCVRVSQGMEFEADPSSRISCCKTNSRSAVTTAG